MIKLYTKKVAAFFTGIMCFAAAHTQAFQLLKDINAQTHSQPTNAVFNSNAFAVLNGKAYFSADDGVHGQELWASDGTLPGTALVKDINPGNGSSVVSSIFAYKGKLYFFIITADFTRSQLYTSDGTDGGTVMLKDSFGIMGYSFPPPSFMVMDDILYFVASNSFANEELWRTDGTTAGTQRLVNFNTPEYDFRSDIQNFTLFNNKLFFTTGFYPKQLWYTDGTTAGTKKFTYFGDVFSSSLSQLTVLGSTLYFLGNGNLYKTTGDSASSKRVSDGSRYNISGLQVLNGKIYLTARDAAFPKYGIFTYNAITPGGLDMFREFKEVPVFAPIVQDSLLFFMAKEDGDPANGLWVTDGVLAHTKALRKDGGSYANFYSAGNQLYFSHNGNNKGWELWVSNGAINGTRILADINDGIYDSKPSNFTLLDTSVLFAANTNANGIELWRTNSGNTALVKDINTAATSHSFPIFYDNQYDTINNRLFFWANDGIHGFEPWGTDGTTAGTVLLKDIQPGNGSGNGATIVSPTEYGQAERVAVDNHLNGYNYFYGTSVTNGWALYKTQGTPATTTFATNVVTTPNGIKPQGIAVFNNNIFTIVNADGSSQLLVYDGVNQPLLLKTGFKAGAGLPNGKIMMGAGSSLYFFVDLQPGLELWKTDGTIAGTQAVKELYPGQLSSSATSYMAAFKNRLFFVANSSYNPAPPAGINNNTNYLWQTNGTAGGTKIVKPVALGNIPMLTVVNNKLYFTATEAATGEELWVTDGTEDGTHMVKDIAAGPGGSNVNSLVGYNGSLYFFADSNGNYGIWKTDGTDTGTTLVIPGAYSVINGGDKLYYVASNKIGQSDGTAAGSMLMDSTGLEGLSPYRMVYVNGRLIFTGNSYTYGTELYANSQSLLPVSWLSFTARLANSDAQLQWATANELHNNYFNIQRSATGAAFTTVGKVYAQNDAKNNYAFTDANITRLGVDKLYYRLQQVDMDGKYAYSRTIQLEVPKAGALKVWPNPASTYTNLYAATAMPGAIIQLVDANGRVLRTSKHNIPAGGSVNISLQGYSKGVYTITVQQPGTKKQEYKVVVE